MFLTLTLSAAAQASSVCIVSAFSRISVACDGDDVKTVELVDNDFTATVSGVLQELLNKGYRIVSATDSDRDSAMWTLVK